VFQNAFRTYLQVLIDVPVYWLTELRISPQVRYSCHLHKVNVQESTNHQAQSSVSEIRKKYYRSCLFFVLAYFFKIPFYKVGKRHGVLREE